VALSFTAGQREAIGEICRRFRVERLEVFGSATRGDLPVSD